MINVRDQFAIFYWIKDRADKLIQESKANEVENPNFEQFAKECSATGQALAMMELARDVLSVNFPSEIAEIDESRRLEMDIKLADKEAKDAAQEAAVNAVVEDMLK